MHQSDTYTSHLKPELEKHGYGALFKTKTRDAMGSTGKVDGCALFYRKSRMQLEDCFTLELNEIAQTYYQLNFSKLTQALESQILSQADYEQQRALLDMGLRRLTRDNVAQVAKFRVTHDPAGAPLEVPKLLLVFNTHLFWDPAYAEVKLWQATMLLKEIESITHQLCQEHGCPYVATMLCGDFNSEPVSAVYKLLASNATGGKKQGPLNPSDIPNDPCIVLSALRAQNKLQHKLPLSSLHTCVLGSEPPFTNLTRALLGWRGAQAGAKSSARCHPPRCILALSRM